MASHKELITSFREVQTETSSAVPGFDVLISTGIEKYLADTKKREEEELRGSTQGEHCHRILRPVHLLGTLCKEKYKTGTRRPF